MILAELGGECLTQRVIRKNSIAHPENWRMQYKQSLHTFQSVQAPEN